MPVTGRTIDAGFLKREHGSQTVSGFPAGNSTWAGWGARGNGSPFAALADDLQDVVSTFETQVVDGRR
ncbi:MAG: hypothetical protein R2761_13710 [Acidimicrobiales bacterium]